MSEGAGSETCQADAVSSFPRKFRVRQLEYTQGGSSKKGSHVYFL